MPDSPLPPASAFSLELTLGDDAPATGRLFIAAVLRTMDAPEDEIDDVKIVVSEALTAITRARRAATAQVTLDPQTGVLRVSPIRPNELSPAGGDFDLIAALFPDATVDDGESLVLTATHSGRR